MKHVITYQNLPDCVKSSIGGIAPWLYELAAPCGPAGAFSMVGSIVYCPLVAWGGVAVMDFTNGFWNMVPGISSIGINRFRIAGSGAWFACNGSDLFVSTDQGASWTTYLNVLGSSLIWDMTTLGSWLYLAAGVDGLWRSKDNGNSWQQIWSDGVKQCFTVFSDGVKIYFNVWGLSMLSGYDDGSPWNDITSDLATIAGCNLAIGCMWARGNSIVVGSGGDAIYYSFNGGGSWHKQTISSSQPEYPSNAIQFFDDGSGLWCAANEGLFLSPDYAATWNLMDANQMGAVAVWDDGLIPPIPGGSSSGSAPDPIARLRLKPFTKRIRASDYRFKAMLQEQLLQPDGMGGSSQHWDDIAPLWVDIKPMNVHEINQAALVGTVVDTRIFLRDPGDLTLKLAADGKITRSLRFVYGTHNYKIAGIIDRGDTIEAVCSEMQPKD